MIHISKRKNKLPLVLFGLLHDQHFLYAATKVLLNSIYIVPFQSEVEFQLIMWLVNNELFLLCVVVGMFERNLLDQVEIDSLIRLPG